MRAWVALLLIAPLLAGCLAGDGTLSARDGLSDATKAARQWVDNPQLIGIASIEPFTEWIEDDFEIYVHLDDEPGDGKAPGWVYVFAGAKNGEPRTAFVMLAGGLGVIAEGFAKEDWGEEPLTAWPLDSTDVARTLRGLDDWPTMGANTTVMWQLYMDGGLPVWCVYLEMPDEWAEACLDAVTGEILDMEVQAYSTFETSEYIHMAHDRDSGALTPLNSLQAQVTIEAPGRIAIDVGYLGNLDGIAIRIEGPEGFSWDDTIASSPSLLGGSWSIDWHGMPAGTYTVEASATVAANVSVDLEGRW